MSNTANNINLCRRVIHPLWKYFYDCNMEKEYICFVHPKWYQYKMLLLCTKRLIMKLLCYFTKDHFKMNRHVR